MSPYIWWNASYKYVNLGIFFQEIYLSQPNKNIKWRIVGIFSKLVLAIIYFGCVLQSHEIIHFQSMKLCMCTKPEIDYYMCASVYPLFMSCSISGHTKLYFITLACLTNDALCTHNSIYASLDPSLYSYPLWPND